MALALGEDGDEDVGAGHLLPPGGLDVDHRALDHPLEAGRGLRILPAIGDQVGELRIDIFDEVAAQEVEVDIAGPHHGRGVLIVDQRQKKMLQRRIFVPALACQGKRAMEGLFKTARKARQGLGVL